MGILLLCVTCHTKRHMQKLGHHVLRYISKLRPSNQKLEEEVMFFEYFSHHQLNKNYAIYEALTLKLCCLLCDSKPDDLKMSLYPGIMLLYCAVF